jgi:hypothetical protein
MATRSLSQRFDMPANPVFLEFMRTDADPDKSSWPENTVEVVDNAGNVNFYHPVAEVVGASLKWKHQVALKVAERMGMEGACPGVYVFGYVNLSQPERTMYSGLGPKDTASLTITRAAKRIHAMMAISLVRTSHSLYRWAPPTLVPLHRLETCQSLSLCSRIRPTRGLADDRRKPGPIQLRV